MTGRSGKLCGWMMSEHLKDKQEFSRQWGGQSRQKVLQGQRPAQMQGRVSQEEGPFVWLETGQERGFSSHGRGLCASG